MSTVETVRDSAERYDAIVVGSGITGGWAAKEFCERGYRTLMIERGRLVEHRRDYIGEGKAPWQMPNRNKVAKAVLERDYPVQQKCYALTDSSKHFFGNDRDLPYSTEVGTRFAWIRANQLGGKSLLWARQSWRLSDFDFGANAADGHGLDWPIRYADLERWYDHVETFIGVSGNRDGLEQVPDMICQPPFEMSTPELLFRKAVESRFSDRKVIIGRTANLTQPTELQVSLGRVLCQARDQCMNGCSFGAYFSTQSATLPAAARTGKLHVAPNSVVQSLIYDARRERVRGVRVIDNEDLSEREYLGRVVFLCASTLGSTQVLLNSASRHFPTGLANRSGVLGHFLMDHNYNSLAHAKVPGYRDEYYRGRRPTGIYVPNFHYKPERYAQGFVRGYAIGGSAYRGGWQGKGWEDGFGVDFKDRLNDAGDWGFSLYAMGEMLPRFENQVSLNPTRKDKWGIPLLHFDCRWSDNELHMMDAASIEQTRMLEAAGFEDVTARLRGEEPGLAIHEVGTARMGRDPKESVFNAWNQAHDVPNLFCTDGSTFCSTGTQNPSLTLMALTARAVDYAAREMKEKRI